MTRATWKISVPALYGMPLALRDETQEKRRAERVQAGLLGERVRHTSTEHCYGSTRHFGWLGAGEPLDPALLALRYASCDFGARVVCTMADDGSGTYAVTIFGSD